MNRIANAFIDTSSVPASSLFIVEGTSPPPEQETKKNFATFSRDIVARMSIAVIVSEGGGFRGAIVRAVGLTLTTIMPHRSRFHFVNDVPAAAELLAPHLQAGGRAAELVRTVDELRNMMPSSKAAR